MNERIKPKNNENTLGQAVRRSMLALSLLVGDPTLADAASKNALAENVKIPAACLGPMNAASQKACEVEFPKQLSALAAYVSDSKNIKSDTPLFNPKLDETRQCKSLQEWLTKQEQNLGTTIRYLQKYQKEWLEGVGKELNKSPQDIAGLEAALKAAPTMLLNCNFVVRLLVFSDKNKKNFDAGAHYLGDAINKMKDDLVRPESTKEQKIEATQAIMALLEALGAAATITE